jgi:hypothetical protein
VGAISEWRVGLQCPDGQVSCMSVGAVARGRITTRSISFPISHLQCNFLWPRLDRSHFATRSISFRDSTRGHGPRQSDRSEKSESSCMIHKFVSDQSGINTVQFHFTLIWTGAGTAVLVYRYSTVLLYTCTSTYRIYVPSAIESFPFSLVSYAIKSQVRFRGTSP